MNERKYICKCMVGREGGVVCKFSPGYAAWTLKLLSPRGEVGVKKLDGGVLPASQNPFPFYDQNPRNFLPYL